MCNNIKLKVQNFEKFKYKCTRFYRNRYLIKFKA